MTQWEYNNVNIKDESASDGLTITILNGYGANGWEFTGLVTDTGFGQEYLMKRELKRGYILLHGGTEDKPPEMPKGDDPRGGHIIKPSKRRSWSIRKKNK